jgi:hypothetical protein
LKVTEEEELRDPLDGMRENEEGKRLVDFF